MSERERTREDELEDLLSEGLDLCMRARRMDEMDRRAATLAGSCDATAWQESGQFARYIGRHNIEYPHQQISTRSGTVALWAQEQYDKDLAEWEQKARTSLLRRSPTR